MPEHDALVGAYCHLRYLPRHQDALRMLQRVASLVKPLMRKRRWRVGSLVEFNNPGLLGMNENRGQRINLRLRYNSDASLFLPLDHIVDTMLHELSHILHGPHDTHFHALWNELRDEYTDLKIKGYTGEGFLSRGHRLGGRRVPQHEFWRQARATSGRQVIQKNSGQRLGGQSAPRSHDIRQVIASAADRRRSIVQGCGSGTEEGVRAADEASKNGFRTQAEEDKANENAIAEALWQLAQEDKAYEPDDGTLWSSEGLSWDPERGLDESHSTVSPMSSESQHPPETIEQRPSRPTQTRSTPTSCNLVPTLTGALSPQARLPQNRPESNWTCSTCTLSNPARFLCCEACGAQRSCLGTIDDFSALSDMIPSGLPSSPDSPLTARPRSETLRPQSAALRTARSLAAASGNPKPPKRSIGWSCHRCGSFHEHQWWTCSSCGAMKQSS